MSGRLSKLASWPRSSTVRCGHSSAHAACAGHARMILALSEPTCGTALVSILQVFQGVDAGAHRGLERGHARLQGDQVVGQRDRLNRAVALLEAHPQSPGVGPHPTGTV